MSISRKDKLKLFRNGMGEIPRHVREQNAEFQEVLLNLGNAFFNYRLLLDTTNKTKDEAVKLLTEKLESLNADWLTYVKNWNKPNLHSFKLREGDFYILVHAKLKELEGGRG